MRSQESQLNKMRGEREMYLEKLRRNEEDRSHPQNSFESPNKVI